MHQAPITGRIFERMQRKSDDASFATQVQSGCANEAFRKERAGESFARIESCADLPPREITHTLRHQMLAQVIVRCEITRRYSKDVGMSGEVYGVCNDGCGRVRHRASIGEDRHRVGDSERKTPALPAAGGNAAHGLTRL